MFGWLRELLEIRFEFKEKKTELSREIKICQSCETLRQQLQIANHEKQVLLTRILEKPEIPKESSPPEVTAPRMLPWNVRRQLLEQEDREKARRMREAPKPEVKPESTDDLEKELGIAAATREAQVSK